MTNPKQTLDNLHEFISAACTYYDQEKSIQILHSIPDVLRVWIKRIKLNHQTEKDEWFRLLSRILLHPALLEQKSELITLLRIEQIPEIRNQIKPGIFQQLRSDLIASWLREPTDEEEMVFELLYMMTNWSELTIGFTRLLKGPILIIEVLKILNNKNNQIGASESAIQNETRKYYEMLIKTSNWALIDLLSPEEVTEWYDLHTKLKFDQNCAAYRYLKEKKFTTE